MHRLRALSVTKMMMLLTASGFLVTLAFAGPLVSDLLRERQKLQVDAQLTSLATTVGNLTHELQKERGASAGYISSAGNSFADILPVQRRASDDAIAGFVQAADVAKSLLPADSTVVLQLADVRRKIAQLAVLRQDIDALQTDLSTAVGTITGLNRAAIAVLPALGKEISFANAARAVQRHAILMTAKDIAGLERATGAAGFAKAAQNGGLFPEQVLSRFNTLVQEQDVLLRIYEQVASQPLAEALGDFAKSPALENVIALRSIANAGDVAAIAAISAEAWFARSTELIDLIKTLEDQGAAELLSETDKALAASGTQIARTVSQLVGLLAIVGLSAMTLARSVVKAISATSDRISALASGDIDSDIPDVGPSDLKRIADALAIFRSGELDRRALNTQQTELEMNSVDGIERMTREVSAGDFSARIRLRDLQGASKILGEGLNQIMSVVEQVTDAQAAKDRKVLEDQVAAARAGERAIEELNAVVSACVRGDFSQRLTTQDKDEVFADLCKGVNRIGEVTENGLSELADVLDALANGDLTRQMSEAHEGVFFDISQKINRTTTQLSQVVSQISGGAQTVEMSSAELSDAADDLAKRTENAAATLEETSASVEELTEAIKSTEQGANEVSKSAQATKEETAESMAAVSDMVQAMEGIAKSSEQISKITSVIDDISFQTNLLALNAGVEAARAGEAGAGFSVVASEVRILAQRAADAAKDINDLISKSEAQVSAGVASVKRSHAALESIQQSISSMTREVVQMVDTAAEQSTGITEINSTVAKMEQSTQRNAAMFEETNAVAQTMKQEASRLALAVSHFTVDQQERGTVSEPVQHLDFDRQAS